MGGYMNLYRLFERTLRAPYIQIRENAASYLVQREKDTLYLLFEKSNGATDWRNNLDFPAKPYREMTERWFVHRGFLRVFKTIEPLIAPYIADRGVKRIVISGYSHGAALALLCHEYCVYHRPDLAENIAGYGFGCPRVVWGFLRKKVKTRFKNFTVVRNCRDVVTHLPPCVFGYRHVGKILHIGRERNFGGIGSHRPESYLAELSREVTA